MAVSAAAGLLVAVGAGLLVATSDHLVDARAFGVQIFLMLVGTTAAALYWLVRRPGNRLGPALLALALATLGLSLQGASQPVLHSLGVLADAFVHVLIYYVVFIFPLGRLVGRLEKVVLAGVLLYFLVAFFPWFFFSPVISGGAPLAGCNAACPANGLMIADRPSIADGFGTDVSAYLVIVALVGALACFAYRLVTATRPRRRALLPVYVPAVMLTVPVVAVNGVFVGLVHLDADTLKKAGWFETVGYIVLPYGFLLAVVQAAFFAAAALKMIAGRLVEHPNSAQLRTILAEALDDRSLELAFRTEPAGAFVDSSGAAIDPTPTADRSSTKLTRNGDTVAVIMHDPALNTDPELVGVAGDALLLALENGRLVNELNLMNSELRATRARIVAAGDAERRKIERDLHDGAQQHLVALRIKVGLAGELADPEAAERLEAVGEELEEILNELRDLGQGLYPPGLRQFGLNEALASVARRSVPPARLEAVGVGRYSEDVEAAVYFCCVESLQNVAKHAGAGVRAVIRLSEHAGRLEFEVEDDGAGWDPGSETRPGAGQTNMADRMASVGGVVAVDSTPGRGTTVRGAVPL